MRRFFLSVFAILGFTVFLTALKTDLFSSLSGILIALIAIFGFQKNPDVWYHRQAHNLVAGILSLFLMIYELLECIFSYINYLINKESVFIPNISVLIIGIFGLIITIYELKLIKKEKEKDEKHYS